jgi:branched-chain amino acid transport system permease protein
MKSAAAVREWVPIGVFALVVLVLTVAISSGAWLTFIMMALYATLLAQSWNLLGGYGGQLSFGHALFFGVGAYAQAMLQVRYGWNAWAALPVAVALAALAGGVVGALSFRYGLGGSIFALTTLVFAEIFRALAETSAFTGGSLGVALPLAESARAMQFGTRRGYIALIGVLVIAALAVTLWLRRSRFGARLQAVRDDADAARAAGVDPFRTKLGAATLSAAFMGAGGMFYVQVFHHIDPGIAFGPGTSVAALLAAIVGGPGTMWGPLLGAVVLHTLGEVTRWLFGALPGIDMVVHGVALVLVVMFLPRGLSGLGTPIGDLLRGRRRG